MAAVRALVATANAVCSRLAAPQAPMTAAAQPLSLLPLDPLHCFPYADCHALSDHSYSSHHYTSASTLSQRSSVGALDEAGDRRAEPGAPGEEVGAPDSPETRDRTPCFSVIAPEMPPPTPLLPTPPPCTRSPSEARSSADAPRSPIIAAPLLSPPLILPAPAPITRHVPSLLSLAIPPPSSLHFICSRLYR